MHCRKRVENEDVGWANNLVGTSIHTPAAMECAGRVSRAVLEVWWRMYLRKDARQRSQQINGCASPLSAPKFQGSKYFRVFNDARSGKSRCLRLLIYIYEDPGIHSGVYSRQTFLGRRTGNMTWDVYQAQG